MIIKIAVDAGHGSNTPGKRTPIMPVDIDFNQDGIVDVKKGTAIREHIANVGVCIILAEELTRCGFTIFKSGWDDENAYDDEDIDITKRQELIRNANCDYSVSVHFNAFGDGKTFNSAEGITTYYHIKDARVRDSKRLAEIVQKHLAGGSKQRNRQVNRGAFGMVNCVGMNTKASVLVELAFMTNRQEAISYMGNATFWKECAVEICKGFCEYLRVAYVPERKVENSQSTVLYQVQAGAYKVINNAQNQKRLLNSIGYKDAYITTITTKSIQLYAVIVGTFSQKANAQTLINQLAQRRIAAIISQKK